MYSLKQLSTWSKMINTSCQLEGNWFSQVYKKTFPPGGQTRREKSTIQPANLPISSNASNGPKCCTHFQKFLFGFGERAFKEVTP